jgi:HSP20 family protein
MASTAASNQAAEVRNSLDRVFSQAVGIPSSGELQLVAIAPVEAWVNRGRTEYHLSIALPGVNPEDIQVNLEGSDLTINAVRQDAASKQGASFLQQELPPGRMRRTITLPEGVDTDKLTARYDNGILEISAPMKPSAMPKRVEVTSGQDGRKTSTQSQ